MSGPLIAISGSLDVQKWVRYRTWRSWQNLLQMKFWTQPMTGCAGGDETRVVRAALGQVDEGGGGRGGHPFLKINGNCVQVPAAIRVRHQVQAQPDRNNQRRARHVIVTPNEKTRNPRGTFPEEMQETEKSIAGLNPTAERTRRADPHKSEPPARRRRPSE